MAQLSVSSSITAWPSQQANSVMIDSNGYQMYSGTMSENGSVQVAAVVQIRGNFKKDWYKTFPGIGDSGFFGMTQLTNGTYICAGYYMTTQDSGSQQIWVVNLDVDGNLLWEQKFGAPGMMSIGKAVVPTSDGGCVVAGYMADLSSVGFTSRIIKLDASGNSIWQSVIPGIAVFSISQNTDGGFVLSGSGPAVTNNMSNPVAVVLDSGGNVKLEQTFSSISLYILNFSDAVQTPDGNFVMVSGNYIVKFNLTGGIIWTVTTNCSFRSVIAAPGGNLVMGGGLQVGDTQNAYIVCTDHTGNNVIWDNTELETSCSLMQVFFDSEANVWGGGFCPFGNGNSMMVLIRINPVTQLQVS